MPGSKRRTTHRIRHLLTSIRFAAAKAARKDNMAQQHYAPNWSQLREDARRLEEQLELLQARIEAELTVPLQVPAQDVRPAAPWDVAPYSWAILGYWRALNLWAQGREQILQWMLAHRNRREMRLWRNRSHDETGLRAV
jgi:hypothetical protein